MVATVDTVALQTGSVKPTSSNQTTASKATSLIESIVANLLCLRGLLYLHNYRM